MPSFRAIDSTISFVTMFCQQFVKPTRNVTITAFHFSCFVKILFKPLGRIVHFWIVNPFGGEHIPDNIHFSPRRQNNPCTKFLKPVFFNNLVFLSECTRCVITGMPCLTKGIRINIINLSLFQFFGEKLCFLMPLPRYPIVIGTHKRLQLEIWKSHSYIRHFFSYILKNITTFFYRILRTINFYPRFDRRLNFIAYLLPFFIPFGTDKSFSGLDFYVQKFKL